MRKGQKGGRGEDSVRGLESRVKSGTDVSEDIPGQEICNSR